MRRITTASAFLYRTELVVLLLEKGADIRARNNKGETPLDLMAVAWGPELENASTLLARALHLELDHETLKRNRPMVADLLRKHGG